MRPQATDPAPGLEFPPFDESVLSLLLRGRAVKEANVRLQRAPAAPETLELLAKQDRVAEALGVLRRIVEDRPEQIARALRIVAEYAHIFRADEARDDVRVARELVAAARSRLSEMPREPGAEAALAVVYAERALGPRSNLEASSLRAIARDYEGTEAALLAQVDLITEGRLTMRQLEDLELFARANPGAAAAAKALYLKGFHLAHNASALRIAPRGEDPTDRFFEVLDIVRELESGAYPSCEWVEKAPELVLRFYFLDSASFTPPNVERLVAAYTDFVRTHLVLDTPDPTTSAAGSAITTSVAKLFALGGDRIGGVEQLLADLEDTITDADPIRYLRALFYVQEAQGTEEHTAAERSVLMQKARRALQAIHDGGGGLYARKSLATLASLYFYERDYTGALPVYRRYLDLYRDTDWSWVAALRVGQCEQAMGDLESSADTYLTAAVTHASEPIADVLGNAYAADVLVALGRTDAAAEALERALEAWDEDYGESYRLWGRQVPRPANEPASVEDGRGVERWRLRGRAAQLQRSAQAPGGADLERGRQLLEQRRPQQAVALLAAVAAEHPDSPMAQEARYLAHRAQLEQALELADVESPSSDEAAALELLERLSAEPYDFAVCAAQIARATILWLRGASAEPEALMQDALREWQSRQVATLREPANGTLEAEVAAIRRVVFRPAGDGIFAGDRWNWNAFTPPTALTPFLIVDPEVSVELPDGETVRLSVPHTMPGFDDRVVFLDSEQLLFLSRIITALGGTRTREPARIMETPNQPVGPSLDVTAFWNKYFPMRPGHWSGWVFRTYPSLTRIRFLDDARTRAGAAVTIGYSGATVILEKEHGAWVAKRLVDRWIT